MIAYRCFLLGREGAVSALEQIDANNKEDALALARAMLGLRSRHAGFELWQDATCIHIESAGSPDAPGDAMAQASV